MRSQGRGKWIFPVIFVAVVLMMVALLFTYMLTDIQGIFLTPLLNDSMGWEIYTQKGDVRTGLTPEEMLETNGETVYLSRVMEEEYETAGITFLELDSARPAAVFLDGSLLYTTCPQISPVLGKIEFPPDYEGIPGRGEAVRFSLPPGFSGKTLTIATTCPEYGGTPGILLTSHMIGDAEIASAVSRAAMPAAAFAVAALLMLGTFLYSGFYGDWNFALLLLLLSAFAQCLRYLADYELATDANYVLSIPVSAFFRPLFIYLPMLFLWFHMQKWRCLCAPFLFIPMLISMVPAMCTVLGVDIGSWYFILSNMLYLALLALLVFSILEFREKKWEFRLFLSGLALIVGGLACVYAFSWAGSGEFYEYIRAAFSAMVDGFSFSAIPVDWMGTILFMLCMIISFVQLIRHMANTQTDLQVLTIKNTVATESLHALQQSNEAIAAARHNMIHHLTAILGLAQAGELERLTEYVSTLSREAAEILPLQITAHPAVNSILVAIQARAYEKDVKTELRVELPGTLPIPDRDLCILLMNMLDNALHAASEVPPECGRWIKFTMHIRNRYLFVETENSFTGPIDMDKNSGLCITRRGAGHGYGMKTMLQIARKYHSELQIEAAGGVFLIRTALLMPE